MVLSHLQHRQSGSRSQVGRPCRRHTGYPGTSCWSQGSKTQQGTGSSRWCHRPQWCPWDTARKLHGHGKMEKQPKQSDTHGAVSPVNHKRIISGLKTNFTLSPTYSFHKSSYQKSCFWAYLYSAGTQHGNLPPVGWPILFCGPTEEPRASYSQHRKNRDRIWKKCRWMDWFGTNKQGRNPWQ